MRLLELKPDQLERVEYDRFHHPSPQVQKRMEVLRLAHHGLPQAQIASLSGLSVPTVQRHLAAYRKGGVEAVAKRNYLGRANGLTPHAATLEAYFKEHPPATVAEAAAVIAEKTGVKRGPTRVAAFLKKIGLGLPQSPGRPRESRPGRPVPVSGWYPVAPAEEGRKG